MEVIRLTTGGAAHLRALLLAGKLLHDIQGLLVHGLVVVMLQSSTVRYTPQSPGSGSPPIDLHDSLRRWTHL